MAVCIVGGGIIGLTTAVELQRIESRAKVTVKRASGSPNTVSDVSAGYWRPIYLPDPREHLVKRWSGVTYDKMEELWREDPLRFGASTASGFEFLESVEYPHYWSDIVHNYRCVEKREREKLGFPGFKDGIFYTTYQIEPVKYLPILESKIIQNGGEVRNERVESLGKLGEAYSVVGNCAGLAGGRLAGDTSVFPIRGQVIRAKAPLAKHFYIIGDDFYVLQNTNEVVLGGTHVSGDWDASVREEDTRFILDGIARFLPWVKELEVVKVQAGLRPGRPTIRLEAEPWESSRRPLTVVHNYGHGGSGITLHQGCAEDAAVLLKEALHRPLRPKI